MAKQMISSVRARDAGRGTVPENVSDKVRQNQTRKDFHGLRPICFKSGVSNPNPAVPTPSLASGKLVYKKTLLLTMEAGRELEAVSRRERIEAGKKASNIVMDYLEGKLVPAQREEAA